MTLNCLNPIFWREKSAEYLLQSLIENPKQITSKEDIKLFGKSVACKGISTLLYPLIIPFVYTWYKLRKPETIDQMETNIRDSLSKKGYSLDIDQPLFDRSRKPELFI